MPRLPTLAAFALMACSAGPPPPPARPTPRVDPAIVLADRLPTGFDRCVVVRARRLSARRRALVSRFSWADPRAYQDGLGIEVFATASVRLPGGELARRSLYRFTGDARTAVDRMGMAVDQGDTCPGPGCGTRAARWLDARTLEVTRHRWPEAEQTPMRRGFWSPDCVSMLRAHPDAFEVAVSRVVRRSRLPSPQWTLRALTGRGGMRRRVERVFSNEPDARRFEQALGLGYDAAETLSPLPVSARVVERSGHRVRVDDRHSWDALELAREDQRLRREAQRQARQRQSPTPLTRVDVSVLDRVRRELVLHRARLEQAGPDTRPTFAQTYATLLDRALAVHPNTPELVRERVSLALRERAEPELALRLLDALLETGPDAPEGWRLLRRESLARLPGDGLERALMEDHVTSQAADAAQAIRQLSGQRMPYEDAERAVRLQDQLFSAESAVVDLASRPRLPLESALASLAFLLRRSHPAPQLLFAAQTSGPAGGSLEAGSPATVVTLGSRTYVVGASAEGLLGLQRLSRKIAEQLRPGPVTWRLELRDGRGQRHARATVQGEVGAGGTFTLHAASAPLATAPWPLVRRYLALPLAALGPALFPSPELRIQADTEERASRLRRLHPDACTASGSTVRCRTDGAFDERMRALLDSVAAP